MSTVTETRPGGRRSGCVTALAILAILALLAAAVVAARPALFGQGKSSITSDEIGASFHDIAELSTEEYNFSRVGSFDQEGFQVAGHTVPFTGRNFLVTFDGTVKAGIRDADGIRADVDDNARTLTISSPKVEVLESHINPDSINVYDQSMNPLNQVRVEDVSGFLAEQERIAQDAAVQQGLLDRARAHTEDLLRSHGEALTEGTKMNGYAVNVNWQ